MPPTNMEDPVRLALLVLEEAVEKIYAIKKDQTGTTLLERKKPMKSNVSSHKYTMPTFGQELMIVTQTRSSARSKCPKLFPVT